MASFNSTKEKMEQLGVYKPEFDDTIKRYLQACTEYRALHARYRKEKYPATVETPTGPKKNPLLTAIEGLRRQIASDETALGLNPAGLLKLKPASYDAPKEQAGWLKVLETGGADSPENKAPKTVKKRSNVT